MMFKIGKSKKKRKIAYVDDEEGDECDGEIKRKKPLFAFWCLPSIHMDAKKLAKELHVDLYIVAEHAMQLGLMDVSAAMKDPEELETLRAHLVQDHVVEHLAESLSAYDMEASEYIREGQCLIHQKERAVRDLIELSVRYRLDPRLLKEIIVQELRRRAELMHSRAT